MSKAAVAAGVSSYICAIFVQDTRQADGSGLTGLAYNTSGLTCYYKRSVDTGAVNAPINNITTLGTFAGSGPNAAFKEVDATNMPGVYELHIPNNAFVSAGPTTVLMLKGAANMAPVVMEFEFDILDKSVGDTYTMRQLLLGYAAALLGKSSGLDTNTAIYRAADDSKNRINATVDNFGNRSAVSLTLT
jgi:hypothetical protein